MGSMKPGLLVASPSLDGSLFARTVILLCDYSNDGAMGLVINKGLAISLADVMEQLEIERRQSEFKDSVLWGGPVEPAAGLVICRSHAGRMPQGCLTQVEGTDLCVSASRVILEDIASGKWQGGYHLCLGYAGWAPGQLDREIDDGSWLVLDFDEHLLSQIPIGDRWQYCVNTLGVGQTMMWVPPIEA